MQTQYYTTPMSLRASAKGWLGLYEMGIKNPDPEMQVAAVFCLFFALELYLKSYLALKDKRFSRERALRELGHDFTKMHAEIAKVAPVALTNEVSGALKQYNLCQNNIIELRYPRAGRGLQLGTLLRGNHALAKVFGLIDREVDAWDRQAWMNLP